MHTLTVNTCDLYVLRLLKGNDNIPIDIYDPRNNVYIRHFMYEFEGKPLYNKIKRGIYSARLEFTPKFIEDVNNIVLRRFNFN